MASPWPKSATSPPNNDFSRKIKKIRKVDFYRKKKEITKVDFNRKRKEI